MSHYVMCASCAKCRVSTVCDVRGLLSGTFAVVSLMTGSVVEQLVPTPLEMNSSFSEAAEFEAQRIGVASAVALLSGIIMVNYFFEDLPTWLSDTVSNFFVCYSCACLVFNWASSPLICQSQLLRLSPVLLPSMLPSHSSKACWGYGFLVTPAPSPSSK